MSRASVNRDNGERGVTAVIVAGIFSTLMVFSAFAVDIGRAYVERRHDQNAVDAGVMSAAVESIHGGGRLQDSVDEIIAKTNIALERTLSTGEWEACTDSAKLPRTAKSLNLTPETECISFSLGYDEIRVQLPEQKVGTSFGKIVGVDTIDTSAFAQAKVAPPDGVGAPPFIALENAQKGDFVCLRTGGTNADEPNSLMDGNGPGNAPTPGTRADPCDSSQYPVSSSTFGTVKPHAYKDSCRQRNQEIKLAIAVGMDHLLGVFPGGYNPDPITGVDPRERVDGYNNCNHELAARPNTLEVDTGFAAQDLKCALLSPKNSDTCENEYPRLRPGPESDYPLSPTVVGERLNNVPPWDHMRPAADLAAESYGIPDSCVIIAAQRPSDNYSLGSDARFNSYRASHPNWQDNHWDPYDRYDMFDNCMDQWDSQTTLPNGDVVFSPELFEESIGLSPRFAFIPQVAESTIVNGQDVHIEGFLPVYLNRLYISDNGSQCGPYDNRSGKFLVHDAGHTWTCGGSNKNVDRLASLVLACGMVPDTLCDKETLIPADAGLDVYDIKLTR